MYKLLAVVITCFFALFAFACASSPSGDSGAPTANGNANMASGLNGNPLPVNGTTPGIPAPSVTNINMNAPGATPIPGIDPKHATLTPNPDPHATPTPGIPSEAQIKKMQSAQGQQSLRSEMNTAPAGNVQRADEMRQQLNKKKPE